MSTVIKATTGFAPLCYAGSAEPFTRPDHKAKRHGRPSRWEERKRRIADQLKRWARSDTGAAGLDLAVMVLTFPPLFMAADWLRYGA